MGEASIASVSGSADAQSALKRRGLIRGAAVLAAALLATRATESVSAADGGNFTLGQSNSATSTTTLTSAAPVTLQVTGGGNTGIASTGNNLGVSGQTAITASGAIGVGGDGGTSGTGVQGTGLVGVKGITDGSDNTTSFGVSGSGAGANSVGVRGAGGYVGIYGSNSASGFGGIGASTAGTGILGVSNGAIGVYGVSYGANGNAYGVVGVTTHAPSFGLYGVATVAGTVGFAAGGQNGAIAGQFGGPVNLYGPNGYLTINGTSGTAGIVTVNGATKNAAMQLPDGSYGLLHCVEAPEPWFEDFGTGKLVAGKAEIALETNFAATVDTSAIHVFLTPHDETHHLAVKATKPGSFSVAASVVGDAVTRGTKASDLSGTFTWRVVAKRKDVKGDRFAHFDVPKEIKLAPPPLPRTPFLPSGKPQ